MAGVSVSYEADEHFDSEVNPDSRRECDDEIKDLIFERSKCKAWATKTRNVCTNFRASVMVTPPGGGEPELKPAVGHMALQTAQTAWADMTKYFRKLDSSQLSKRYL